MSLRGWRPLVLRRSWHSHQGLYLQPATKFMLFLNSRKYIYETVSLQIYWFLWYICNVKTRSILELFFSLLSAWWNNMTVSCILLPDSDQGIISQLYILESFLIPSSSAVLPCSQSGADQMHSSHWFSVNHKIVVRQIWQYWCAVSTDINKFITGFTNDCKQVTSYSFLTWHKILKKLFKRAVNLWSKIKLYNDRLYISQTRLLN